MCLPAIPPAVLLGASIAATVGSTAIAAYSTYQQQKSANQAADYNAKMLERNAEIANMQAEHVIKQGAVEEKQHRLKVAQLKGSARAASSGTGLLADDGTFLANQQDIEGFGELDALTIRSNFAREAWGVRNSSSDFSAQANLSRMKKANPAIGASGSLLSGVSTLGSQLYQYKKAA